MKKYNAELFTEEPVKTKCIKFSKIDKYLRNLIIDDYMYKLQ